MDINIIVSDIVSRIKAAVNMSESVRIYLDTPPHIVVFFSIEHLPSCLIHI